MPAYLKIENIGVCPPEGFTVLGVSLADTSNNEGVIGQFGSGNKHGVAVCLRAGLAPVVFAGSLKMEFSTKPQTVTDGLASKDFGRVVVKYGGSDPITGADRSSTEDLGFVLDYGRQDWQEVALALREFVSNAIDRSIREKGDWSGVKIEIVDESQVRAKRDYTRVLVPMNAELLEFFNNLGKWFLHFSEPESLNKAILPKRNRNLSERKAAVIYRRGVRVREFESSDTESLFDYNLDDLTIDEARKASDWDVKHHCGKALANADRDIVAGLSKSEWANVKRAGAVLPAGKICPTAKPYSADPNADPVNVIPTSKWTEGMKSIAADAEYLGRELMGVPVTVAVVHTTNNFVACYGQGRLDFNLLRLGHKWFEQGATEEVDRLLIHEFGHQFSGDHLSEDYHDALCRLGAGMKTLAMEHPEELRQFMPK